MSCAGGEEPRHPAWKKGKEPRHPAWRVCRPIRTGARITFPVRTPEFLSARNSCVLAGWELVPLLLQARCLGSSPSPGKMPGFLSFARQDAWVPLLLQARCLDSSPSPGKMPGFLSFARQDA